METDPSHRELPESYRLRYMGFACSEIEEALIKYEQLSKLLGDSSLISKAKILC